MSQPQRKWPTHIATVGVAVCMVMALILIARRFSITGNRAVWEARGFAMIAFAAMTCLGFWVWTLRRQLGEARRRLAAQLAGGAATLTASERFDELKRGQWLDGGSADDPVAHHRTEEQSRTALCIAKSEQLACHTCRQSALAELGRRAIAEADLAIFMQEVVQSAVTTLGVEFGTVDVWDAEVLHFRTRAGIGWREGTVPDVHAELPSLQSFALAADEPVIVDDWKTESRFLPGHAYREHGVTCTVGVAVRGAHRSFGVLSVHSTQRLRFRADDLNFLQMVAVLLAGAFQRSRVEQELRESRERLMEVQRAVGIGSWEWNIQTGHVWWSDELYSIFALDRAEFRPTLESFLKHVLPDDQAIVRDQIQASLERDENYAVTYRARLSDGSIRFHSAQARLHRDVHGKPARMIGTCQDITEQRRVQLQLRRTERLASLGTLAAGIAHEINNPLAAAWAAAETAKMLQEKPGAQAMFRESLDTVADAVQRSRIIIDNVLRFARQESSEKKPHDLNEIVRRAVETTAYFTKTYLSAVELRLPDNLPQPSVSAQEIEQVLVNLIRNAVQAGNASLITVSTEAELGVVRIRVSDNGRGIPQSLLERIFDPFYTYHDAVGGVGLGLAISHGIVADHKGSIDVESQIDVGTTFVIALPASAPEAPNRHTHRRQNNVRTSSIVEPIEP